MQIHKVLILKSTSEIGYFSNAWKLNHNIPPKKLGKESYQNSQSERVHLIKLSGWW